MRRKEGCKKEEEKGVKMKKDGKAALRERRRESEG